MRENIWHLVKKNNFEAVYFSEFDHENFIFHPVMRNICWITMLRCVLYHLKNGSCK